MNAMTAQRNEKPVRHDDSAEQAYLSPEVNIFETKDGYILEAEMAGVNKQGLELSLEGNVLTITGRRTVDTPRDELIYRESRPAHFRRVFELEPAIDTAKISAKMDQGILTLSLPKAERVKPRKILIDN